MNEARGGNCWRSEEEEEGGGKTPPGPSTKESIIRVLLVNLCVREVNDGRLRIPGWARREINAPLCFRDI